MHYETELQAHSHSFRQFVLYLRLLTTYDSQEHQMMQRPADQQAGRELAFSSSVLMSFKAGLHEGFKL